MHQYRLHITCSMTLGKQRYFRKLSILLCNIYTIKHNRNKPAKKITATTGENKQLKGDTYKWEGEILCNEVPNYVNTWKHLLESSNSVLYSACKMQSFQKKLKYQIFLKSFCKETWFIRTKSNSWKNFISTIITVKGSTTELYFNCVFHVKLY